MFESDGAMGSRGMGGGNNNGGGGRPETAEGTDADTIWCMADGGGLGRMANGMVEDDGPDGGPEGRPETAEGTDTDAIGCMADGGGVGGTASGMVEDDGPDGGHEGRPVIDVDADDVRPTAAPASRLIKHR
jgi:hypothetical protein